MEPTAGHKYLKESWLLQKNTKLYSSGSYTSQQQQKKNGTKGDYSFNKSWIIIIYYFLQRVYMDLSSSVSLYYGDWVSD